MQIKTFSIESGKNQIVSDAYSMLSTNIYLCSELTRIKSLLICSYEQGVGKTTLATSLAVTMAGWGRKVLLADLDIRKSFEMKQNGDAENGISDYLRGRIVFEDALCKTNVENLTYLSWGKNLANPMGLLCSSDFDNFMNRIANEYDFIIFDSPSLSAVSDASLIASKVDATLLLVRMGKTKLSSLQRAKEQLEEVNGNILGVVVNRVKNKSYKKYFKAYNYFRKVSKSTKNKGSELDIPIYI